MSSEVCGARKQLNPAITCTPCSLYVHLGVCVCVCMNVQVYMHMRMGIIGLFVDLSHSRVRHAMGVACAIHCVVFFLYSCCLACTCT